MPLIALVALIRFSWVGPAFVLVSAWVLWPMLVFPDNDTAMYLWWGLHLVALVVRVAIFAIRAYLQYAQRKVEAAERKVEAAVLQAADEAKRAKAARVERINHPWSTYSGTPSYTYSAYYRSPQNSS